MLCGVATKQSLVLLFHKLWRHCAVSRVNGHKYMFLESFATLVTYTAH